MSRNQEQVLSLVSELDLRTGTLRGHEKGSTVGGLAPRRPTHAQGAQLGARLGKEAGEGQGAPLRSAARARVPHSGAATEVGGARRSMMRCRELTSEGSRVETRRSTDATQSSWGCYRGAAETPPRGPSKTPT